MPLRSLSVSTRILLHPAFMSDQARFAIDHGVNLVKDVTPTTDFRNNPAGSGKTMINKATIHLVQQDAISLFVKRRGDETWIRKINITPGLLLYCYEYALLVESELPKALELVTRTVAPLLADQDDCRHILPGLANDDPIAYWSNVTSCVLLPGVDVCHLHHLWHPQTGAAQGTTPKRIKLESRDQAFELILENAGWSTSGSNKAVSGVRAILSLGKGEPSRLFGPSGEKAEIKNHIRLVSFHASDIARAHNLVVSQMEGIHLPIPTEWTDMGDPLTHAKVIALLLVLTPTPVDKLLAWDDHIRKPSVSTRKRLKTSIREAKKCLKPIPASTLFTASTNAHDHKG